MSSAQAPGLSWLAARTGRAPGELASSPVPAVRAALRELASLASRAESEDPQVREAADAELTALREEIAAAPRPSDTFLVTVAGVLLDAAERLRARPPEGGAA